jgi:hypothetical protein
MENYLIDLCPRAKKFDCRVMEYQPVVVNRPPRPTSSKHSTESRYWRQFKHPIFVKEYAPVTSIHFSPSKPHRYAVTAATRVQLYAPRSQKVTKTISRFRDVARSGNIRSDGKLVVAGDDTGLVQVIFCTASRSPLSSVRSLISTQGQYFAHSTPTSSLSMSPSFHPSPLHNYYRVQMILLPKSGILLLRQLFPPFHPIQTMSVRVNSPRVIHSLS